MNNFSIIIPIFNESKNIEKLINEIYHHLYNFNNFEIIIVNDGSTDDTQLILKKIKQEHQINIVNLPKKNGQSFAIRQGALNAKNNILITIDGDGQNNPADIEKLLFFFVKKKIFSLVGGIRVRRKDSFIKILSSKIANFLRNLILQDECSDTGCSLKVFDKNVFLSFPFFDGMHRFLPALFKGYGKKNYFIYVDHRPREFGTSKYDTFGRGIRGIRDLIKVVKIIKKFKRGHA